MGSFFHPHQDLPSEACSGDTQKLSTSFYFCHWLRVSQLLLSNNLWNVSDDSVVSRIISLLLSLIAAYLAY